MSEDCVFCKIIAKEIPADIVYDEQDLLAFHDINPQAPVHVLFIPRKHIATVNDVSDQDRDTVFRILSRMRDFAEEKGFSDKGYRIVVNCNEQGGQEVFHLHFHFLAGRDLRWPPG